MIMIIPCISGTDKPGIDEFGNDENANKPENKKNLNIKRSGQEHECDDNNKPGDDASNYQGFF